MSERELRVAGLDCGKNSVVCCVMAQIPADFRKFARRAKTVKIQANREGIETLLSIDADIFGIEPTGAYSRLWIESLRNAGKDVRLVQANRIKFLMRSAGILNKNDKLDSAGIALYTLQNIHNPNAFLNPGLGEIRDAISGRGGIAKSNQALKNRIGSRLAYEWPEGCKPWTQLFRQWEAPPRPIIAAIAGKNTENGWVQRHLTSMDRSIGLGISPTTRKLAEQYYQASLDLADMERQISVLLSADYLEPYNKALDLFLAGPALRANLIPCIYPFERFLTDGKRNIEYTPGSRGQRSKRDRSEAAFKLSCGMGRIQYQSGDSWRWKAGGSIDCRSAIWQYVKTQVVMCRVSNKKENRIPELVQRHDRPDVSPWLNPVIVDAIAQATAVPRELATLRVHYDCCGKVGPKREMATASRFIRMLYKLLLKEFT